MPDDCASPGAPIAAPESAVEAQEEDGPAPEGAVDEPTVDARLAAVEEALAALARRHDSEAERAAARERVIDRQHADIERLRAVERAGRCDR